MLPGAVLILAVVICYLPALRNGFIWDDDSYLTQNSLIRDEDGLRRIWFEPLASPQYYPLVFTTFRLEHHLWGFNPFGYHLVNVLLHAAAALLLWLLLRRLTVPGAWLAALWFGIHPVQVESVAWITERKNVLSGFFYLAAFHACLHALRMEGRSEESGDPSRRNLDRGWYALALLLFTGAILAKTVTATLPIAVALVWWWKRDRGWPVAWKALTPFAALGACAGVMTVWIEAHHVGAQGAAWFLPPLERVLVAGRALWFYAGKLLYPRKLMFMYPRWRIDTGDWRHYVPPLAAVVLLLVLWRLRVRLGRGPLTGVLFFAATLAPALGFVNVYPMRYSFVADHFQYLACIGPLALIAAAGTRMGAWLGKRAGRRWLTVAGMALVVLLASVLLGRATWRQTADYQNERTLWVNTLERNPQSAIAHLNLGIILGREGRLDEALGHFRSSRELEPEDAESHHNIGKILLLQGKHQEAKEAFETALRLDPWSPASMTGLGAALAALGDRPGAERRYRQALAIAPDQWQAAYNLGQLLVDEGKLDEAVVRLRDLLRSRPEEPSVHFLLGVALDRGGQAREAAAEHREALRLRPDDAPMRIQYGLILARLGDAAGAITQLREALRLRPDDGEVRYHLARALELDGRKEEALGAYREAVRLRPDDPDSLNDLGALLAERGEKVEAIRHFREALRLRPDFAEARANLNRLINRPRHRGAGAGQ